MELRVNGVTEHYPSGTLLADIAAAHAHEESCAIALAMVDGRLRELANTAVEGTDVSFITIADGIGYDAYRRSCSMLFLTALQNVLGDEKGRAVLHFAVAEGFYFSLAPDVTPDEELLKAVTGEMKRLSDACLPFFKRTVPTAEARKIFRSAGMTDKDLLFRTRMASRTNIYRLGTFEDYYYGFMVHDASVLRTYELIPFKGGVVLQMPGKGKPGVVPPFKTSEKLFNAQIQGEKWAETQGISTVGDLNHIIINGDGGRMVMVSEALQESAISNIAAEISSRPSVKFIMIAGPSSSGKTTFSQRLSIQLSAHGMRPHYIGIDNYFIDRDKMVPGPDGKLDFESLSAVDVSQFNSDMEKLLAGETIRIPSFDFVTGRRIYTGETLAFGEQDVLVIEGLHALNDDFSAAIPSGKKFKVYISALTQLNIDEHNRVPSRDGRLIRRIVRDNRTRGYTASQTLSMWSSVCAGEEKYIFPFQESADVVFNSALPYEIAALKTYAQPLLFQVPSDDPGWYEARRLLKFLDYFIAIPSEGVPINSLLREFIGGGCFRL